MTPKKNPKADLSRKTGLFFAIGLAVATSLSLFAINYKTSDGTAGDVELSKVNDRLDEDVEEVVLQNEPPPQQPPPVAAPPEIIEVVDNKEIINQKDDWNMDTSKEEQIAAPPVLDKVEDDIPDDVVVPFAIIEDKPMFEVCKKLPKAQQDNCFKEQLDRHVQRNFKYPEMAQEMGIQGRVFVQFKINRDGTVLVTGVRGPDKSLEAEARRIIEKLPKIEPGKQRGKPVAVTYSYPIMFKLN